MTDAASVVKPWRRRSWRQLLWRRGPRSIRRRLLVALLAPMAAVNIGSLPVDYRTAVAPSERAYDETLVTEAQAIAAQIVQRDRHLVLDLSSQAERILRTDPIDQEFFSVHDHTGRLLGGDAFFPPQPNVGVAPSYTNLSLDIGGKPVPIRLVAMQVRVGDSDVLVQVGETLLKRKATGRSILAAMVLPNLLIAALTVVTFYVAVRLALAPLDDLDRELQKRAPDALRPVKLTVEPVELAGVVGSLNALLLRVEDAAGRQQRVLANMAHQLRTPLTGLRTQIELAVMQGRFDDDLQRKQHIMGALDQLGHLIDQILTLSRAEAGREHVSFEPIDLRRLIERRVTPFVDRAIARGVDLGFALQPTAPTLGNPFLVGEQLSNLIDNALQHCPHGSVVTVLCGTHDGRPWMAVEDDGPGIAPALREQVFSRFFSGRQDGAGSSGLGLAIVREIAQLHCAELRLCDTAGRRGIRFEVKFARPA